MPLVTFNENVDHHVKGDVVKLSADELKAIDLYAEQHNIEKPYTKGEQEVTNTDDTPNITDVARENSLKRGKAKKDPNAKTDEVKGNDLLESDDESSATDKLIENANKQAVGETLPGQEGDNPSDVDLEAAAEDAQEDEAEEQAATPGEGSADVAAAQNDDSAADDAGESDDAEEVATETETETDAATELPVQEDAKEGEDSGDVTPPATTAKKAAPKK